MPIIGIFKPDETNVQCLNIELANA